MEITEIKKIINFMNSLYPNRKLSLDKETVDNWKMMFEEYGYEEVKSSIISLSKQKTYIPNIPEIIENIKHSFKLSIIKLEGSYLVKITYNDMILPFRFDDELTVDNFKDKLLRKRPMREEMIELFETHVVNRNRDIIAPMKIIDIKDVNKKHNQQILENNRELKNEMIKLFAIGGH